MARGFRVLHFAFCISLLSLPGCGRQSFAEAEAIWRDEAAKLDEMEKEWQREKDAIFSDELVDRVTSPITAKIERDHPGVGLIEYKQLLDAHESEILAAVKAAAEPEMESLRRRLKPTHDAQKKRVEEAFNAKEAAKR